MKTNNAHNNRITGIPARGPWGLPVPTTGNDAHRAYRPSLTPACLMCLLLYLLMSPAIADSSATQPDPNGPSVQNAKEPKPGNWLIAKTPTTDLTRELWRDRIRVPKRKNDSKTKEQLLHIIEQIRSIEFKPQDKAPEPVVFVEPLPQTEPNKTAPEPHDQNEPELQKPQIIQPRPQHGIVSDETLQILTEKLLHPEQLNNPFELGEILFNADRPKEAAVCYRQALARIDPNQPDPAENKPWILFQIGNCLRKDEPQKALEAYSQLISEYAGSLWTDLAKARSKLIDWYLQDKPRTLIDESRQQPTDDTGPPEYMLTTKSQTKTEQSKGG